MTVINSQKAEPLFFDTYRSEVEQVFGILGMPADAVSSLDRAVALTQPWIKGDHSRPQHEFDLTETQKDDLRVQFEKMDMTKERCFPGGQYDQIIVLGAIHAGNMRRAEFTAKMLNDPEITVEKVVLLGGQRRIYAEKETDDLRDNLAHIALNGRTNAWVENFQADFFAGEADQKWETDFIRLAASLHMGRLTLKRLHLQLGNTDPIRRYEFDSKGLPVHLLHTMAVARPNGEARHTTEACIQDWVEVFDPPEHARVGMVGANPHADRMLRAAKAVLRGIGRDDIELVLGSAPAFAGTGESIYLGEVARSLYEDLRVSS